MKTLILLAFAVVVSAGLAVADPVIQVHTSLAPNAFGSPSWGGYQSNAVYAMQNGLSSYGPSGDPTQYQEVTSPVTRASAVVTGFNSWLGVANPGAPYQNEEGNRMTFGLHILGNGTKFSISQMSFSGISTGDANGLGVSFAEGSYGYSANYVGINYGADGVKGGGDDTYITSGASTQLVDELDGRGSGNSYAAYVDPNGVLTNQQELDAVANDPAAQWVTFTGTYSLDLGGSSVSGSGTFRAVPEPGTIAALGIGLLAIIRKRKGSRNR